MKRFTIGRERGKPVVLLNGVKQETPYMPYIDGAYIGRIETPLQIKTPREMLRLAKRNIKLRVEAADFSVAGRMFLDEEQWLLMQARFLREKLRKQRTHRHSSPNCNVYREYPTTRIRDLLMFTSGG